MPEMGALQWVLGVTCAFFVGIAKTGIPGIGILVVPLMVLTVGDARLSAGWLLPVLCTADVFAVLYWRRHAAATRLFSLAPWVLAGMAAGAVALALNERVLRPIVGATVLIMLAIYLLRRWRPETFGHTVHGGPYGVAAGFATTVANAAGPVMNIYLLSKHLTKEEFVAMGAWFFFAINLTKLPIYAWHGLISRESMIFNAIVIPAVLAGAVTGRWMIYRIPARLFEMSIVILTALSTLLLFR
jgi:uncharacterized membrane protein YfcA